MARPKKPEAEKQIHVAAFRLTEAEYEAFEALSKETKLTKARLAKYAAMGMKHIYITDELVNEARNLSRQCAQIGNLLRLHATLLEVIDQNPALTESDRQEIGKLRELLTQSAEEVRVLRKSVSELRKDVQELTHGDL